MFLAYQHRFLYIRAQKICICPNRLQTGQSVNTDSTLKITRKITCTGRPPSLAGASLYTTTITPPSLA